MKTKVEMVSLFKERGGFANTPGYVEGSLNFESQVDRRLEQLESVGCTIVDIKYTFTAEKNAYIYTAMIIYTY